MYKLFKTIHLLGLAAGFGGILAGIQIRHSAGAWPQVLGPCMLGALAVAGLSGAAMMVRARLSPLRQPWLLAHFVAAGIGALAAAMQATPLAATLSSSRWTSIEVLSVLALGVALVLGALKPRFGRRASSGS